MTRNEVIDYLRAVNHPENPNFCEWGDRLNSLGTRKLARYRAFLYFKQGMRCYYCDCKMKLGGYIPSKRVVQPDELATFEHLDDAWSHGKRNEDLDRIVLACRSCNAERSEERSRQAYEFYKSKFASIQEYKKFAQGASAGDFIAKFGKMPAADEAYKGMRTLPVRKPKLSIGVVVDEQTVKINQIMEDTNMDYIQARHHLQDKEFLNFKFSNR